MLVGQEAHFNCTISRGWKLIMWSLNDTVVLIVTTTQLIIPDKRFFSKSYEEGGNFISELIIYDVQPSDAGHVKCSLENSDHQRSAFLSVQGAYAGNSEGEHSEPIGFSVRGMEGTF